MVIELELREEIKSYRANYLGGEAEKWRPNPHI